MSVSKSWPQLKALKDGLVAGYNTILQTIRTEEANDELQDIEIFKMWDMRPSSDGRIKMGIQPTTIQFEPKAQASLDVIQFVDIAVFFGLTTEDHDEIAKHKCFYFDAVIQYLVDNYDLDGNVSLTDPINAEYETGGESQRASVAMRITLNNEWRYC